MIGTQHIFLERSVEISRFAHHLSVFLRGSPLILRDTIGWSRAWLSHQMPFRFAECGGLDELQSAVRQPEKVKIIINHGILETFQRALAQLGIHVPRV
jgi:hypothetical protein